VLTGAGAGELGTLGCVGSTHGGDAEVVVSAASDIGAKTIADVKSINNARALARFFFKRITSS
jgi:hypothetical protein